MSKLKNFIEVFLFTLLVGIVDWAVSVFIYFSKDEPDFYFRGLQGIFVGGMVTGVYYFVIGLLAGFIYRRPVSFKHKWAFFFYCCTLLFSIHYFEFKYLKLAPTFLTSSLLVLPLLISTILSASLFKRAR